MKILVAGCMNNVDMRLGNYLFGFLEMVGKGSTEFKRVLFHFNGVLVDIMVLTG